MVALRLLLCCTLAAALAPRPLDLRFDTAHGVPASEFLRTVPHAELVRIISEYGEEAGGGHVARRIADVVCLARARGALPTTTKAFAELVARAKGKETSGQLMHPAKMTFQALRMEVNDELATTEPESPMDLQ